MPDEGASWGDGHLPIVSLFQSLYISALPPLLLGSASRGR